MEKGSVNTEAVRLAPCASHAVGMEKNVGKRRWVIGIVLNNTEISSRNKLVKLGYEAYVPSQTEIRVWKDGRRKKVERILFKNFVFLFVTEKERLEILNTPVVKECYRRKQLRRRPSSLSDGDSIIEIPEADMEKMKFMLFHSENPVSIENTILHVGDMIEVSRGSLQGLKGRILEETNGRTCIVVNLGILGSAKVEISRDDVVKVNE